MSTVQIFRTLNSYSEPLLAIKNSLELFMVVLLFRSFRFAKQFRALQTIQSCLRPFRAFKMKSELCNTI